MYLTCYSWIPWNSTLNTNTKKSRIILPPLLYTCTQGWTHDYNTRQRDDIRTNRTRINLTEKCLRKYLPKAINSIPNHILTRIDTHSIEGFASAVKHYLISKYSTECQDENCYVCQRQPRSWFVNCSPLNTMCISLLYRYFVLIAHLFC